MKKLLLTLFLLTAIIFGCKKYDEGPSFSFRSAKHRLYGTFKLVQYTVNGVDSLDHYYDSLSLYFCFRNDDDNHHDYCDMFGRRRDGGASYLNWSWELIDKNKILKIKSSGGNPDGCSSGPFRNYVLPEWIILRLTNNELKMKTTFDGKEYLIDLNKL